MSILIWLGCEFMWKEEYTFRNFKNNFIFRFVRLCMILWFLIFNLGDYDYYMLLFIKF